MEQIDFALRNLHKKHLSLVSWERMKRIPHNAAGKCRERDIRYLFETWEMQKMAGKSKSTNDSFGDTWFANIRLSERDRAAYDLWLEELDSNHVLAVEVILQQGWKVSVNFSSDNDGYVASATMKDVKDVNAGAVVTSWAGDWFDALMTTVYKITVLIGDDTIPHDNGKVRWG